MESEKHLTINERWNLWRNNAYRFSSGRGHYHYSIERTEFVLKLRSCNIKEGDFVICAGVVRFRREEDLLFVKLREGN